MQQQCHQLSRIKKFKSFQLTRNDVLSSLEKERKRIVKLEREITTRSSVRTTGTLVNQKFKSCEIARKDILQSLEKGGKRLTNLERIVQ